MKTKYNTVHKGIKTVETTTPSRPINELPFYKRENNQTGIVFNSDKITS
jgi:hypothetical protein